MSDAATGINSENTVSGFFSDITGHTKGFPLDLGTGANAHVEAPTSTFTPFLGGNNIGVAVGFSDDGNGIPHGLVYNSIGDELTTIDAPGATGDTVLTRSITRMRPSASPPTATATCTDLLVDNV